MKKIILAVFVLLAILSLNTGCQKKTGSLDLFGTGVKTEKLEKVTLTLYLIENFRPVNKQVIREVLDEIERRTRKTLNIKLDFRYIPYRAYKNEIIKAIETGKPLDMFLYFADDIINILREVYDTEIALDISELIQEYAPSYYSRLDPWELVLHEIDGKLLAVPGHFPFPNRICAIVRDDLMQKYNIPPIKSFADFEVYMDTVKSNEEDNSLLGVNNYILGLFAPGNGYVILDFGMALVYKWDDPEMKVMAWEQTPEYRGAVERAYNWYQKGYLLKDIFYIEPDDSLICSEKWVAWLRYQFSAFNFNTVLHEADADWRYLEYPLFPDALAQSDTSRYQGLVVSAYSENPERALMFIEWLHASQENYDLIRYGIEKKHYLLKGDQYAIPEGIAVRDALAYSQYPVFWDMDYERTNIANSKTYRDEIIKFYKDKTKYPPHGNFHIDESKIKKAGRVIDLHKMEDIIARGRFNSNSIAEFIADQKKSGIDNLVAEVQAQLDEWRKQNSAEN